MIDKENSLAYRFPELAAEWHPTKNGELSPTKVSHGSNRKVWWICSKGHEWEASISNRCKGQGCPYCAGKRVVCGFNDLASISPHLLEEWDYEDNLPFSPSSVMSKSNRKFWWKCRYGHKWQATPNNRSNGSGCPYCSGRLVISGNNDLATIFPALAHDWDYEKNAPTTPNDVACKSNKKYWWKCEKGHSWEETVSNRASNRGCPFCSGHQVLQGYNDLLSLNPSLAAEWDYEKNGLLLPQSITASSSKRVWWKCSKGHSWQAPPSRRNSTGTGCPYCSGRYVIEGESDLATINHSLAEEWNYSRNGELTPDKICANSEKKVWWLCPICKHEWQATPSSRNSSGTGCPKCSKRNHTSFPEQAIFYYTERYFPDAINSYRESFLGNMELDIFIPSRMIGIEYDGIWHKDKKSDELKYNTCKQNGIVLVRILEENVYQSNSHCDVSILSYYNGRKDSSLESCISELLIYLGCKDPDVNIVRDRVSINLQYLSKLRTNSLAQKYPEIAAEWHPNKNQGMLPEMFNWGAGERVWWKCHCGYEWQATISSRTSNRSGCPSCGKTKTKKGQLRHRLKDGKNSITATHPHLITEWNYEKNLDIDITQVTPHSNQKVWWRCNKGHEWRTTVNSRTAGTGCPYCSGKRVWVGFNDLCTIRPDILTMWNYRRNTECTPEQFTEHSNKRVWWLCDKGHEWNASINSISNGRGCPYCKGRLVLPGFNDLETLRPDLMLEWNYRRNEGINPNQVTEHSGKKAWWKCKEGHEWYAVIDSRAKGHGCPICGHIRTSEKLRAKQRDLKP